MNLAVNARDAMPAGGKLAIATTNVEIATEASAASDLPAGRYVQLTVKDTGTGMDAATMTQIFEPFFTTKEQGRGTGLGLAMVFGIVKQSGGEIRVTSELGWGTTFKIYLPLAERGAGNPSGASMLASRKELPPQGSETVLLVEDEAAVRLLASTVLTSLGYTVLIASGGAEALAIAQGHPGALDLLLTDMVMPEMGGREVADRLSGGQPGLKVVYMSGFPLEARLRQRTIEAGAAYLQKPFTPLVLARKVRATLDS
jgi:CheY-like chemotaxis protein